MLIGHYGPALGLKALAPRVPLWALFLAVQFVDILWACFVLAGIEHVRIVPGFTASNALDLFDIPWSHSLLAMLVWSAVAGMLAACFFPGARRRVALAVALAVFSHFVLDFLVHVPDLTVAGNHTPRLGLGLWNLLPVALALEVVVFAAGLLVLLRSSWANTRRRRLLAGGLGVVMVLAIVPSYFAPAPPSIIALVISALFTYAGMAVAVGFVVDGEARALWPALRLK